MDAADRCGSLQEMHTRNQNVTYDVCTWPASSDQLLTTRVRGAQANRIVIAAMHGFSFVNEPNRIQPGTLGRPKKEPVLNEQLKQANRNYSSNYGYIVYEIAERKKFVYRQLGS